MVHCAYIDDACILAVYSEIQEQPYSVYHDAVLAVGNIGTSPEARSFTLMRSSDRASGSSGGVPGAELSLSLYMCTINVSKL